jgi:hypothetical protein
MIEINIPCRRCGEPTIEIEFAKGWRRVCNNWTCPLYRECQGTREKLVDLAGIETFMPAPLPKRPSPPRGMIKKVSKKIARRKGLVYARKTF